MYRAAVFVWMWSLELLRTGIAVLACFLHDIVVRQLIAVCGNKIYFVEVRMGTASRTIISCLLLTSLSGICIGFNSTNSVLVSKNSIWNIWHNWTQ